MISLKVLKFNAIWCSACLVMKKTYNRIFDEYKEFKVITYDYDIDENMVTKYNIGTTIPVLIFLNNNDEEITRIIGEKSYDYIKNVIETEVKQNNEV